jgi:hypothetical protein
MSPTRHADPELDSLIDEITIDCHDEDEQLTAFETAFDQEASFPCPATVIGENVEVLSVSTTNNRRELIAVCQRGGHRYQIALLDIDIQADATTTSLLAAYRRWIRD